MKCWADLKNNNPIIVWHYVTQDKTRNNTCVTWDPWEMYSDIHTTACFRSDWLKLLKHFQQCLKLVIVSTAANNQREWSTVQQFSSLCLTYNTVLPVRCQVPHRHHEFHKLSLQHYEQLGMCWCFVPLLSVHCRDEYSCTTSTPNRTIAHWTVCEHLNCIAPVSLHAVSFSILLDFITSLVLCDVMSHNNWIIFFKSAQHFT